MKKYVIIGVFMLLAIVISCFVIMNYSYKKEEMIQQSNLEQEKIKIKAEQDYKNKVESEKQKNLSSCIDNAKISRKKLWDSNDTDKDGKVNSDIAKWIEDIYNSEVNTCSDRYK